MEESNLFWGYDVRIANNIKDMVEGFDEDGYDIKILCNHHEEVPEIPQLLDFEDMSLEDKSMIIFFSGTDDLSTLINKDEKARVNVSEAHLLFDYAFSFENFGVQKLRI